MNEETSLFELLCKELEQREPVQGISIADVIEFPAPLSGTIRRMVRGRSMSVAEIAADLGLTVIESGRLAELMVDKGLVTTTIPEGGGEPIYRVRLIHLRQRRGPSEALAE